MSHVRRDIISIKTPWGDARKALWTSFWSVQCLRLTARPTALLRDLRCFPSRRQTEWLIPAAPLNERYRLCVVCGGVGVCLRASARQMEGQRAWWRQSQSDQRSTARLDPHSPEFIALVCQAAGRKPSLCSPSQTALIYPHLGLVKAASASTGRLFLTVWSLRVFTSRCFSASVQKGNKDQRHKEIK